MNFSDRRYDQNAHEPLSPLLTDQQSNFLRLIATRYQAGFRSSFVVVTKPRGTAEDSTMRYADGDWAPVTIDGLDLQYLAQVGMITMQMLAPWLYRVMPTPLGIQVGTTLDPTRIDVGTDAETDESIRKSASIMVPEGAARRPRGFPANKDDHYRVAGVISNFDADWPSRLNEVCQAFQNVDADFPETLRSQGYETWEEIAEDILGAGNSSLREGVVKHIKYRIKWVRRNQPA